jgi:hypothetical protein
MRLVSRLGKLSCLGVLSCLAGCSTVIGIDGSYTDLGADKPDASAGASNSDGAAGASGAGAGASNSDGGAGASSAGSCAGVALNGACWYFSSLGASCSATCAAHGGDAPNAPSFVGVPAQGGSLAKCASLLVALGYDSTKPGQATRSDAAGVGCHVYGLKSYWLSAPAYSPDAHLGSAKLVCGCVE